MYGVFVVCPSDLDSSSHWLKSQKMFFIFSLFVPPWSKSNPGTPLRCFNDGGWGGGKADRGSYFIPFKPYKKIQKSHTSSKLRLCYCWFELMKRKYQKNFLCFFVIPKSPCVFHRPKNIHFSQNFRPKNILWSPPLPPPCISKICEWGPWEIKSIFFILTLVFHFKKEQNQNSFSKNLKCYGK